ncbi:MAG: endonuclease MutS2 [Chloroflexi bacterium]|nr:endonuclease MutS2 [Chloroflexota bacterium]
MLDRLARLTASPAGRERALALRPVAERPAAVLRQRLAAEAAWLREASVSPGLGAARDVRDSADAAARGLRLAPLVLREVADTIRCAAGVRRALARAREGAPLLAAEGAALPDLDALGRLLDGAIDARGELLDGASAELSQIRSELAETHDLLLARMQSIVASPTLRPALSDAIVTQRDGRYVVPVRAEARSALPGVVHDTSSSGRTVYVEPFAVVELGNRWRELRVQERREVERILRELSGVVGESAADLVASVERLAAIDLAFASAALGRELGAGLPADRGPEQPWLIDAPGELRLLGARHPLLVWEGGEVVPVSLAVGGAERGLLITGPNTGGKTVALKSAGLITLMALCGLPVPAEAGSTIPVYDAVFADIGDEQSIEQSLSTFSSHVTAIIDVIERAGARSLALLDELGAGTDPQEGAVLAVAIVESLIAAGVTLIATTHHGELKAHAHDHPLLLNASVEFDVETLSPTYRLRMGIPGESNALAISERLGMPADVVEAARGAIAGDQRELARMLADLREQLERAESRAGEAEHDRAEARRLRAELAARYEELEVESERRRAEATRRLDEELRDTERLLQRTRRQVEAARLEQAAADMARAREAARAVRRPPPAPRPASGGRRGTVAVVPGARVWLAGMAVPGEAVSPPDARGEFELTLGALRTRARLAQVVRTEVPRSDEGARVRLPSTPVDDPGESIEVRGRTLDEALPAVEEYLDRAIRSGRSRVLVIHGKGTGTLRRAVRELLARHPLVASHEPAESAEGGEGVTVAHLASL